MCQPRPLCLTFDISAPPHRGTLNITNNCPAWTPFCCKLKYDGIPSWPELGSPSLPWEDYQQFGTLPPFAGTLSRSSTEPCQPLFWTILLPNPTPPITGQQNPPWGQEAIDVDVETDVSHLQHKNQLGVAFSSDEVPVKPFDWSLKFLTAI